MKGTEGAGAEDYAGFRAGFVPITGLPNAGKSTLMNSLCGTRLSIISDKPQTTRNNILGILNAPGLQAVFVDTPGFLRGRNLFERSMAGAIKRAAAEEGDLCILITEPGLPPEDKLPLFEPLKRLTCPLFLAVNKLDKEKSPDRAKAAADHFSKLLPVTQVFLISALTGGGLKELRAAIKAALPEHPPVCEIEGPGREQGHLPYRFGQAHKPFIPHIPADEPGKAPGPPGVGLAAAGGSGKRPDRTVGPYHRAGEREEAPEVRFVHRKKYRACPYPLIDKYLE